MPKTFHQNLQPGGGTSVWLDWLFQKITMGLAIAILLLVGAMGVGLGVKAMAAMEQFGFPFLWTTEWNPVEQIYGILPQIYGTLVSSIAALGIGMPLGISIAIFLNERIVPAIIRQPLAYGISLLAAIPSVVYGLWGIFVLLPFLQPILIWLHHTLGWMPLFSTFPSHRSLLPAILVLVIMILPIIVAIVGEAIASVPNELRLGAAALGANRWQFIFHIALPASGSGIMAAAVLAFGRAIGEAMAVVMLIGNAHQMNWSWLAPSSTIASLVANQFTEATGLQISALLYASFVLMIITVVVNLSANYLLVFISSPIPKDVKRDSQPTIPEAQTSETGKPLSGASIPSVVDGMVNSALQNKPTITFQWHLPLIQRQLVSLLWTTGTGLSTGVAIYVFGSILFSLITKGGSRLDLAALTQLPPPPLAVGGGFRNAITGTLLMVGIGLGLSTPIGLGAGIYLAEQGKGRIIATWVRFFNSLLSGIPSILCGLFIYTLVVVPSKTFSAVAGGVALALVMVPIITRTAEEAFKAVPSQLKTGAIALGATPLQATLSIILPHATPALVTGILLAIARGTGETAPLLFTALFNQFGFNGLHSLWQPTASLSVLIYNFALSPYPNHQALAWTAAFVLVLLILSISIIARVCLRPSNQLQGLRG